MVSYRYSSLEDSLISNPLTVNGIAADGWGATFTVKGREIKASILFADISSFSSRTGCAPKKSAGSGVRMYILNTLICITLMARRRQQGAKCLFQKNP